MQAVSALWKTLAAKDAHREYRFDINGVEYSEEEVSHSTDQKLFEEMGIGNAYSATLNLKIDAPTIPKGATIKRFVRLVWGDTVSEWIPKGVFFTNTRSFEDGIWEVQAFDAMRKAEKTWEPDSSLVFPLSVADAVSEFARLIGVEVDERTSLKEYTTGHPGNDYTIRQMLQFIAAAHGGNWIITDAGKLLLVPLRSAPDIQTDSYLVTEDGYAITFGGVRIIV